MIKASGLWLNKSDKGVSFFRGNLGGVRVVIFKNTFKKEGSNEPDYEMYFDEQKKKDTQEATPKVKNPLDDDIPF
jgi:hypothetical protein